MRVRAAASFVFGSFVVYVAMVACAASDHGIASQPQVDSGHVLDAIADIVQDALSDALVESPVPDAKADDTGTGSTEIVTTCDKTVTDPTTGATSYYAEAVFPGRSRDALAFVRPIICGRTGVLPGYDCEHATNTWVRDGAVAVECFVHDAATTVVFVAPAS